VEIIQELGGGNQKRKTGLCGVSCKGYLGIPHKAEGSEGGSGPERFDSGGRSRDGISRRGRMGETGLRGSKKKGGIQGTLLNWGT